ncbi:MAG: helix-turn-helix transcriptional regulator [Myxococcota bacterium]
MATNRVRLYRENLMLSKAELARRAGLSALTIDRVEAGRPCRLDTKRKILTALGLEVVDKQSVFGGPDAWSPQINRPSSSRLNSTV